MGEPKELRVVGEMMPAPRGPVLTTLMALTGVLLVVRGARLFARLALSYRKPAELVVSEDGGVRVHWRTELLDRTLGDRDVHVPRESLLRTTREVLYPRLTTYAGLLALVTGTLVGVTTLVDGVRASSPSLVASGLAVVAAGLGLDFAASILTPGLRGRCRVIVVPRSGSPLCIGAVDVATADALLTRLSGKENGTGRTEDRKDEADRGNEGTNPS
jgi:hypothetical protein